MCKWVRVGTGGRGGRHTFTLPESVPLPAIATLQPPAVATHTWVATCLDLSDAPAGERTVKLSTKSQQPHSFNPCGSKVNPRIQAGLRLEFNSGENPQNKISSVLPFLKVVHHQGTKIMKLEVIIVFILILKELLRPFQIESGERGGEV